MTTPVGSAPMTFADLDLHPNIVASLEARGMTTPTPIQAESLPHSLEGRDILGRARTGTGKTLAFALPIVTRLEPTRAKGRKPRAIVLAPTRELAKQVAKEFSLLGGLEVLELYGGTSYVTQERTLRFGVDVVVGTPGRVQDHINRGTLDLTQVEFVVLDEADEMLSMGFQEQVEKILESAPSDRQTMLFSATMPRWVERLAAKHQTKAIKVDLVSDNVAVQASNVQHHSVRIQPAQRTRVLADLLTILAPERAIIFTRTKRDCDELALELIHRGFEAEAIHGDLAQSQRERALEGFRAGRSRVLVATDVAARGIDIPDIELVVQHHFPHDAESYVHRSGRTGRAGRSGKAIVMYTAREERDLRNLERTTGVRFEAMNAPAAPEVRAAAARHAAKELERIPEDVLAPFAVEAEKLMDHYGIGALARALAVIAGVTESAAPVKAGSLITGEEGMTTLEMRGARLTISRAVAMLAKAGNLSSKVLGKIQMFGAGIYVDVPNHLAPKLLALSPIEDVQLSGATELEAPRDFKPRDDRRGGGNSRGYANNRSNDRSNERRGNDRYTNEPRREYKYRDDRGNAVAPRADTPRTEGTRTDAPRTDAPRDDRSRREFSPAPQSSGGGFQRGKRFERRG